MQYFRLVCSYKLIFCYRDARIVEIYAGPTDIQQLLVADLTAKEYGLKAR